MEAMRGVKNAMMMMAIGYLALYLCACSSGGKFVIGWLPVTEIDERQTLTRDETKPRR